VFWSVATHESPASAAASAPVEPPAPVVPPPDVPPPDVPPVPVVVRPPVFDEPPSDDELPPVVDPSVFVFALLAFTAVSEPHAIAVETQRPKPMPKRRKFMVANHIRRRTVGQPVARPP
jgi:hypothetical protein